MSVPRLGNGHFYCWNLLNKDCHTIKENIRQFCLEVMRDRYVFEKKDSLL